MDSCIIYRASVASPVHRIMKRAFHGVEDTYVLPEWLQDKEPEVVMYLISGRPPRRSTMLRMRHGITSARLVRSFSSDIIEAMLERTRETARAEVPGIDDTEDMETLLQMMDTFQAHWQVHFCRMLIEVLYVMLRPQEED